MRRLLAPSTQIDDAGSTRIARRAAAHDRCTVSKVPWRCSKRGHVGEPDEEFQAPCADTRRPLTSRPTAAPEGCDARSISHRERAMPFDRHQRSDSPTGCFVAGNRAMRAAGPRLGKTAGILQLRGENCPLRAYEMKLGLLVHRPTARPALLHRVQMASACQPRRQPRRVFQKSRAARSRVRFRSMMFIEVPSEIVLAIGADRL